MSFVGYVLGLGDRHSENILLEATTGAVVHVDFNCLFEKVYRPVSPIDIQGQSFEKPERVPFRLTQNLVDALGVTGYDGVFRRAGEVTMRLLRDNSDTLMSVLESFIHDPLVEWNRKKVVVLFPLLIIRKATSLEPKAKMTKVAKLC
jgi:serine/threonine-protein kinase ATR